MAWFAKRSIPETEGFHLIKSTRRLKREVMRIGFDGKKSRY